jgi:tRNA-specific 2-thiouridylase
MNVAEKKDSQEICFVTSGKHDEFVRARSAGVDTSGEIVTTEGQVVGEHPGIEGFTIGQRKGLGVAMGEPYFVARIETDTNRVVIGQRDALNRTELTANQTNWLVDPPADAFRCQAMIRYNSHPAPATATALPDHRLHVVFDDPRFGVAPGQAVVCYDGERLLGGGWIE